LYRENLSVRIDYKDGISIYEELNNYKPNYYIAYDIVFPGDKYEDFIKKLKAKNLMIQDLK
jgi:hypothetical protein